DTAELLSVAGGVEIENTALYTEKYIRTLRDENGAHIPKIEEKHVFSKAECELLSALHDAQTLALRGLACRYTQVGELKSRMAVGLGSSSVFETGMILHKPYGFPYIPGSAVKGALRHLIIGEAFMGDENRAAGDADFAAVFGKQDHRGKLLFFDVYPSGIDQLELDIMNPHFSDYYMSRKPPTDTYNPTPIVFRVVPAGTKFTFCIAGDADRTVSGRPIRDWFSDLMRYAGFGAKTAVGYGWMTPLSAAEDTAPVASRIGTAIEEKLLQKAKRGESDSHAAPMPKRGFNEKTVKLVFNKIKNSVLNSEDRRVLAELANVRESDADYAKWERYVRQARAWAERQNPK
ncbi:MAG: type III-B CRISPR module RAMP protein Cmr6, partial [Clostridiales Family XIII bacterium]|nr:type III-B CRISPR module RAMP protein Cmr6 [Clostridiales Family XIII bacterium]